MASLFDIDTSSDSEGDLDWNPENESDVSDEESVCMNNDEKLLPYENGVKGKECTENSEDDEIVNTGDQPVTGKTNADDVWKSFLEEVAEIKPKREKTVSDICSIAACSEEESGKGVQSASKSSTPKEIPAEIFEFAGETICVANDGSVVSSAKPDKEENPIKKDEDAPPVKRKGLQSVLGTLLNKKQKITTLQKTALDWKSYKKDEGIEEELEKFNKGKGGFIERQRFLQRSDMKSYEMERDMRLLKKIKKN